MGRLGFIHEKLDIKILILYILRRLPGTVDPETLADELWAALNEDNKVSLFVRYINRADGTHQDVIRNKHQ